MVAQVKATQTPPAEVYRDPEVYEDERRLVFGRSWQFIGHSSELAKTGDVITAVFAGYPVIAVVVDADLDRAGQLRPGDRVRFSPIPASASWPPSQTVE